MDNNRYRKKPVNNQMFILTSWVNNEACSLVLLSQLRRINNERLCFYRQKKELLNMRYELHFLVILET